MDNPCFRCTRMIEQMCMLGRTRSLYLSLAYMRGCLLVVYVHDRSGDPVLSDDACSSMMADSKRGTCLRQ